MPSKSGKQHRLMEARAHGAKFAMAKKIPVNVAKDFALADIGRKSAPPKVKEKS